MSNSQKLPVVFDLDGTLIRSDMLFESAVLLLRKNLFYIFLFPFWLLCGKARLKYEIACRVEIEPEFLPYDARILEYLSEKATQCDVVLATATTQKIAFRIAKHLGVFFRVFASDANINLSSQKKADILVGAFGEKGFVYAGNSNHDLAVWSRAHAAVLANGSHSLEKHVRKRFNVETVFPKLAWSWVSFFKMLRLHQWLKNLLVFVPLLAAHRLHDIWAWRQSVLAFLAFGFCASSVYVLNDLLDASDDRKHHYKKFRPLASGAIALSVALFSGCLCLMVAFIVVFQVSKFAVLLLLLYWVLTMAYSFKLKKIALVDVLVLSGFYVLRILMGGVATEITISFWLMALSLFFFLGLSVIKRYVEIIRVNSSENRTLAGRGYSSRDLPFLVAFGVSCGFVSVLVFALYITHENVVALYRCPQILWGATLCLVYIIGRIWLKAVRDELHDDPVIFFAKDVPSLLALFVFVGIFILASVL